MVSFADDMRLYYGISNVDDRATSQNDLNSAYNMQLGFMSGKDNMQFGLMPEREQLMPFSSCDKYKKTPSKEEAVLRFCGFREGN